MRPHPFAVCVLSLLAFSAEPASGQARARHEREWESKAKKMEAHLLRTMRKHGVDQEELWLIRSDP